MDNLKIVVVCFHTFCVRRTVRPRALDPDFTGSGLVFLIQEINKKSDTKGMKTKQKVFKIIYRPSVEVY